MIPSLGDTKTIRPLAGSGHAVSKQKKKKSGSFPPCFKLCTLYFVSGFICNSYRAGGTVLETHLFSDTISLVNTTKLLSFRWESLYIAFNQPLFLYSSRLWPFSCLVKTETDQHIWMHAEQITGRKIES